MVLKAFQTRIIPACAGETFTVTVTLVVDGDHPRLRGGNWILAQIT